MASPPADSMVQCPGCRTQFQPRAVNNNFTRCPQCGRFLDVITCAAPAASPADEAYGLAPVEASSAAAIPATTPASTTTTNCPHCQSNLAPGAVLCIKCGFDLRKGAKLQTQRVEVAANSPAKKKSGGAGNNRKCPVCGSPLLQRETRCSKCKLRTPIGEETQRPGEELSDDTGVKLIKIDQALRERGAWFAGRTLVPLREGTLQRLLGCGCDVGAIVAGWVLWAAKPLLVLFSLAAFGYLIQFGFWTAMLGSMICGTGLFVATFLIGFFLGFPFGFLMGLLGYEDVGWG